MLQRLVKILTAVNIKFSRIIIFSSIAAAAILSIFIKNLYFDNDLTDWIPEKSSIGRLPHYTAKKFGSSTPVLVLLKFDDCFTYENLTLLKLISDSIRDMNGVDMVLSLADMDDISSENGSIKISKLLKFPLPMDREYYSKLKNHVLKSDLFRQTVVSEDSTTAAIIVKPANNYRSDTTAFNIRKKVESMTSGKKVTVYFGGLPSFLNSITVIVLKDFVILIPLVIIVVVSVLYYSFRTLRGIFLPLLSVAFSTLMALGLMGLFKIPLNIMSVTIPVVLVACCNAYGIHVLNRYYEKLTLFNDKKEIIKEVMSEISLPVILSGLTAVFGFLSLSTAQIGIVKDFGIFTGIGIFFATFISLMFIPSFLFIGKKQNCFRMKNSGTGTVKTGKISEYFTNITMKHRKAVIIVFTAASLAGLFFSTKLISKVDYLAYFDKKSEPRVTADFTMDKFGGYFPYSIYIRSDIASPDVLKVMLISEAMMKSYTHSNPSGIADMVLALNQAMTGVKTIPDTGEEIQNLLFFTEGKPEIGSLMTADRKEALVSCMLKSTDPPYINGLESYIKNYLSHFTDNIVSINNYPDNPELPGIEKIFVGNTLNRDKENFSGNEIEKIVSELVLSNKTFVPRFDREKLLKYMTGDESEIPLDRIQALKLISLIVRSGKYDDASIIKTIGDEVPAGTGGDDIRAFAKSAAFLIGEDNRNARIEFLKKILGKYSAALGIVTGDDLGYAVAPLVWKTIPSENPGGKEIAGRIPVQEIGQTGYAYVAEMLRREILRDQVMSLGITLLAVFIFNAYAYRSFKKGLLSMIAMPFTLIINFALMAVFKIPLDIVTVTIGSISIIGIDYTLHFIARYSIEMKKNSGDPAAAIRLTYSTAGKAIIFNALSVGLGFAVLIFSSIIALRNLGFLLFAAMLTSSIASLVLLPAVIGSGKVMKNGGKENMGEIKNISGS